MTYADYLRSEEWLSRRDKLFRERGRKCEACRFDKRLSIHHLTYERIFRESDLDLLVLCAVCHEKAERGKDDGIIPKRGDAIDLRLLTIRFIRTDTQPSKSISKNETDQVLARNERQIELLSDPTFVSAMVEMERSQFKKWCKRRFSRKDHSGKANAVALYDRSRR